MQMLNDFDYSKWQDTRAIFENLVYQRHLVLKIIIFRPDNRWNYNNVTWNHRLSRLSVCSFIDCFPLENRHVLNLKYFEFTPKWWVFWTSSVGMWFVQVSATIQRMACHCNEFSLVTKLKPKIVQPNPMKPQRRQMKMQPKPLADLPEHLRNSKRQKISQNQLQWTMQRSFRCLEIRNSSM